MEITTSLFGYIKDDYIPPPIVIPTREVKEILLDCEETNCPLCGALLRVYYTTKPRFLISILFDMWISVRNKRCTNPDCIMCQNHIPIHNPDLERIVFYDHQYAYDVILLIGHLTSINYTENEVAKYLLDNHGIDICQPDVNHYKHIALAISQATLLSNIDTVRERLAALPCRVYSLDGTNSNFSETLFIVRELITGLVLGVAILTEHDKETVHTFLEEIFTRFGRPDYLVRGRRARNHCSRAGILSRSSLCILSAALSQELGKGLDGRCRKRPEQGSKKNDLALKIFRLGKQLDLEIDALSLDPTNPDNVDVLAAAQAIRNLLALSQAVFSRSVSDVFPFFLEGVEAYHNAEALLVAFQFLLVQERHEIPTQSPAYIVIFRYVHSLIDLLQLILKDPT